MGFQVLERMLTPTRRPLRGNARLGFSVPLMVELPLDRPASPYLVTSSDGKFLVGTPGKDGVARVGVTESPLGQEDGILLNLVAALPIRFGTVDEAIVGMNTRGFPVRSIVLGEDEVAAQGVPLEEARVRMATQGFVTVVDDVQILLTSALKGCKLVATLPALSGFYLRMGDYLGVLVRADAVGVITLPDEPFPS